MRVIYKYNLDVISKVQSLRVPGMLPEIKHVAVQNGQITLWIEVDPGDGLLETDFKVVATGEAYNGDVWEHVGTVLMLEGSYVWHIMKARKI